MKITHILAILLIVVALIFSACTSTPPPTKSPPETQFQFNPERLKEIISLLEKNSSSPQATTSSPTTTNMQELKVYYLDVGQGDSVLVDYGQTEILIDGGDRSSGIVSYVSPYIDGALEAMVATHPHADHIGGLIDILAEFQVMDIWLNGDTATSATFTSFTNSVNAEGANIHQAERGNKIQVGSLEFNILNPAKPLFSDTNNNSIVLSLSYGDG